VHVRQQDGSVGAFLIGVASVRVEKDDVPRVKSTLPPTMLELPHRRFYNRERITASQWDSVQMNVPATIFADAMKQGHVSSFAFALATDKETPPLRDGFSQRASHPI
jgi:hypothetical protein